MTCANEGVVTDRMRRVKMMKCVACVMLNEEQKSITDVHHLIHLPDGTKLKQGCKRAPDEYTIPLCSRIHHWNGVHCRLKWCLEAFEAHVGYTEPELWEITNRMLDEMD